MPRWASPGPSRRNGALAVPAWNSRDGLRQRGVAATLWAPQDGLLKKLGYYALRAYLFVYLSRILDLTVPELKIPRMLTVVFVAAAVISGGAFSVFRSRIAILAGAFYFWMGVCVPFSVWRGGSAQTMAHTARSLALMMGIIALATTARQCTRLMYTAGLAAFVAAAASMVAGRQNIAERLILAAGTFADPNFYCLGLYLGIPFLWLRARNSKHPFAKIFYLACTLVILVAGIPTGSRMGLAALCVMVGVLFFRSPAGRKLRIAMLAGVALAAATLVFSEQLLQRYTTLFSMDPAEGPSEQRRQLLQGSAVASTYGRMHMLRRSLELTAKHPIFGVGPGMFAVAENQEARERGRKGVWLETHNSFTQVSSETGIPGFLLYVPPLILAARALARVRKLPAPADAPQWSQVRNAAHYLEAVYYGGLVGAMFLSIAYHGPIFMLLGLVAALERAAAREAQQLGSAASSPSGPSLR